MKALLNKLNIDETFTKQRPIKQPVYNKFKNNLPLKEDYNFMADLIELPETKKKFKYLLTVVDLASDEFDIEPLKTKTPAEVLEAFKTMIKRKHIKLPYASIRTDNGNEFKGSFNKYLTEQGVLHKKNLPNRHKQMANVEALNKQLVRLFNGYMNGKEKKLKKIYREWTDIINIVRTDLNEYRKKTYNNPLPKSTFDYKKVGEPKFKLGDIVHYRLDRAENALGNKQPTPNFRVGDYRYSAVPKKIINVSIFNDEPYYRYILDGMPNVSYSKYELILSNKKDTKFKVKKLLEKKRIKGKLHYLVWWIGYKKSEATWEPMDKLIEDGFGDEINEFNNH
jgi:hypothetical protein